MRLRHVALAVLAATAVAGATGGSASAAPTAPSLPSSMAAVGDSITRAYDINWLHLLSDSPQYSWSTGTSSVSSQYQRILSHNPAISGHAFNDAKTGADMSALDGQVLTAKSQGVQYLTVLMGANDLCTSSAASMTPTATFKTEFDKALSDFTLNNPTAIISVSSIPNIYQLWSVEHGNSAAQGAWNTFGICPSMLKSSNTEAQRQLVVTQEAVDNQILQADCTANPQCKPDNYATFNYAFTGADISTVDYFHPSTTGQTHLAATSWGASYWPTQ